MLFFILVLVVIVVLIYIYFHNAYKYWKKLRVPQLNPQFPFGDMAGVIFRKQNMGDRIKQIYLNERNKGHDFVGLYFFSRKAFLPLDPILIKNILGRDFQYFSDRGIYYDEENDPLSAHLFSIAGTKWKHLRSKLTPAYSPVKLKGMFDIILKCGDQMADLIKEVAMDKGELEIKEVLARYSTDVIGCCAFGLDCNTMRDPEAEFRKMGKRAFTQTIGDVIKMIIIRSFPFLAKLLRIGVFSAKVKKFFQRIVKDTMDYREVNGIERKDFLQLLIELRRNGIIAEDDKSQVNIDPGKTLTTDEAAAQAFIFFLAGFETTSTTISFALFEMACNQEIQAKARQEVLEVLSKHGDQPTYEGLLGMKYLDMVIYETLRKYPPAPVFLRKCTKRYLIPKTNSYIEEGQSVLIPCLGLHRDPDFFPNPEDFDPERFSDENKLQIVDGSYIPFGSGPRNCLGMRFAMVQAKIALTLSLMNFKFELSERTILPLKMETKGIILSPIGGLWIKFTPRNI
ncbi:probable cytochrome P450 6a14 isoform X2 [Anthonomus grandis grandis]|nr:probable cytochrome P450 6a14 isoform X2 [Anthonomus grandis grandis]